MEYDVIAKPAVDQMRVRPNLADVEAAREGFRWESVYDELDWLPGGYLNKAHECIDRHCEAGRGDKVALIWEGKNGEEESYTFSRHEAIGDRQVRQRARGSWASQHGDRVFHIHGAAAGTLLRYVRRAQARAPIVGPLFSAFGPDPVRDRMQDSGARRPHHAARPAQAHRRGAALTCPPWKHTIIVNKLTAATSDAARQRATSATASPHGRPHQANYDTATTSMYDYSVIHYTSGTTGKPKGRRAPAPRRCPAVRHRQVGAGLPSRGPLLVHRGPRLGDGYLVRHVRARGPTA